MGDGILKLLVLETGKQKAIMALLLRGDRFLFISFTCIKDIQETMWRGLSYNIPGMRTVWHVRGGQRYFTVHISNNST